MSTEAGHVLMLNPPRRGVLVFGTGWECVCGAGGSGANEPSAEWQYGLHLQGLWPCWMGEVPGTHPVTVTSIDGKPMTVWVK